MSTEIKNTLFRFATMRAPELIEDEKINSTFIKHPENEKNENETFTSTFLKAAYANSSQESKKARLINAANTFKPTAIKTLKELKGNIVSESFYEFATWLSKNRTKLKTETLNIELLKLGATNNLRLANIGNENTYNILWENLLYQVITSQSNYVRDAILMLLTADFFLKKHLTIEQSEKSLNRLAQSRIVIPTILISTEESTQTEASKTFSNKNVIALEKELINVKAQEKIAIYNQSIVELKKEQKIYNKEEQKSYEAAKKIYETAVKSYYETAEIQQKTIIDRETEQEKTIAVYEKPTIPDFEYIKKPEVGNTVALESRLAEPTKQDLTSLLMSSERYESFDEIITDLEDNINTQNELVFENSTLNETLINTGGVVIPISNTITPSNTFIISSSGYGFVPTMPITLYFDTNFDSKIVQSTNYKAIYNETTEIAQSQFQTQFINGKLFVTIFPNGIDLNQISSFKLQGELIFSDNTKVKFKGDAVLHTPNMLYFDGYNVQGKGAYSFELMNTDNSDDDNILDYIPTGFGIKRLGIVDYRKVEQEICCYVPGEVSHIENVMAREYKERSTRRLRRSENTTTTTKEKESEHLTDSSSTDRFEMNQEVSSVLSEDTHFGVNGNVTGDFGKIKVSVGADYANNTSSEESNMQAVNHAKEVTEKVLERVIQKVKEERVSKIIEEFEENNKHGFDNREGEKHVSGVFRWVDKIYKNKVVNFGKRLMYEFMIPEPAAFHMMAIENKKDNGGFEKIEKPTDPRTAKSDIALKLDNTFDTKYKHWVALYNVEIEQLPKQKTAVSKGFDGNFNKTGYFTSGQDIIRIPEGYEVNKATASASFDFHPDGMEASGITINIGNQFHNLQWNRHFNLSNLQFNNLGNIRNELAVAYKAFDCGTFSMTVVAECELTAETKQKWQLDTFNAIIRAYEAKLEEYNAKIAQAKAMQGEKMKTNPLFFREIENTVLRKNCIEYITSHEIPGGRPLIDYGNAPLQLKNLKVMYDDKYLETYAARVKFLEQAFEWDIMSYNFYPFYWAEKDKWNDLYNITDIDDATHKAFLQSGMARVIVTVRPGFEEAVNWYMATGQVWNGGQVPTVDDPLFLSIVDELRVTTGEIEETWETRVPTSLTIIQAGEIGLEVDKALPCCEDRGDNPFGFSEEKSKFIEFTFYDGSGASFATIGELDTYNLFPRVFKCMGQTITINRDAAWTSTTHASVIFEKLTKEISLINGIEALVPKTLNGSPALGITFKVDCNLVNNFTFTKPGGDPDGYDGLNLTIQKESLMILRRDYMYYEDSIIDKNKVALKNNEINTLLPLSRFLV